MAVAGAQEPAQAQAHQRQPGRAAKSTIVIGPLPYGQVLPQEPVDHPAPTEAQAIEDILKVKEFIASDPLPRHQA